MSALPALARLALLSGLLTLTTAQAAEPQRPRLVLEDQHVPGKVQRPEVTLVVTRQNLRPDVQIELRESFIPKIVASADQTPL